MRHWRACNRCYVHEMISLDVKTVHQKAIDRKTWPRNATEINTTKNVCLCGVCGVCTDYIETDGAQSGSCAKTVERCSELGALVSSYWAMQTFSFSSIGAAWMNASMAVPICTYISFFSSRIERDASKLLLLPLNTIHRNCFIVFCNARVCVNAFTLAIVILRLLRASWGN